MGRFGCRKWTLILIRDASRPVWRTKFPRFLLYAIPAAVLLTAVTITLWQLQLFRGLVSEIALLHQTISANRVHYEHELERKDETILQLQTDLLELSEKAALVELELDALRRLEEELRELSGFSEKQSEEIRARGGIAANASGLPVPLGGTARNATREQVSRLVRQTDQALLTSRMRLQELSLSFGEIKEWILQDILLRNHTPSIWPADSRKVTSGYGFRRDPFTGRAQFHYGIDISGNTNDPVYATADGTVEAVGSDHLKGNYILINHRFGIRTQYMHLNKVLVKKGETVVKGQEIGKMGSTGRSTGTHLHYEVHVNRKETDPQPYMKEEHDR